MSMICELHDKAMLLMSMAFSMKEAHDIDTCAKFLLACEYESEAAFMIDKTPETEPSRGMLFLGAASLAWHGQDFDLAERLVAEGLSGYPAPAAQHDLRRLYDDIKFSRYVAENNSTLNEAEATIRFYGAEVGYGRVSANEFIKKIEAIGKIIERTAQRKAGFAFQTTSNNLKKQASYRFDIELAEAGSFGVKVKLSFNNKTHLSLLQAKADEIVSDVVENIDLMNAGDTAKIKEKIQDVDYFVNFITQARELAPDGERITSIGIASNKQQAVFRESKKSLRNIFKLALEQKKDKNAENEKTIRGILKVSDGIKGEFQILKENGEKVKLQVRDGLDDLARKYFGETVDATCELVGKHYQLMDLTPVE